MTLPRVPKSKEEQPPQHKENCGVKEDFVTCPYREGDEEAVLSLLNAVLGPTRGGNRNPTFWRWKHISNHFGPSFVYLARTNADEIAGFRAFMQWQFEADGHAVKAVRAVDTATHPDHQRKGVFTSLTLHALREVESNGVQLVFNTPNRYSLPGYLKMGWQYVAPIKPLIKVVSYRRLLADVVKTALLRQRARSPEKAPSEDQAPGAGELAAIPGFPCLLQKDLSFRDPSQLSTRQDIDYICWRYARHPVCQYRVLTEEEGGQLAAAAVFRENLRFGLRELMLTELWVSTPRPDPAWRLLKRIQRCTQAGYMTAFFSPGSLKRSILKSCGFFEAPRRGLNLAVKPLRDGPGADCLDWRSWDLTLGDLEFF